MLKKQVNLNKDCGCDDTKCYNISMGCVVPVIANADNYYTKSQVDEIVEGIEVSGVTEEQVEEMINSSLEDYYDSDEIDSALSAKQDVTDMTDYTLTSVTESLSNDLSAHTTNTNIHVSIEDKTTWSSKQNQLVSGQNIKTINNESLLGSGNIDIEGGGVTPEQVEQMINSSLENYYNESEVDDALALKQDISGMTNYATTATTSALSNDLTAHTSNSEIHVSQSEKNNWNNKSNFSGDYNDLSNKPTNVSAFINDSGYITNSDLSDYATESDLSAHTADTSIHVTSADKTTWNAKQDLLVSGINIKTINDIPLLGSGNIEIGGGGTITIDPSLDPTSENAVANSAITNTINSVSAQTTAHTADTSIHVTSADKTNWDNKSNFSGNYNDLTNKPTNVSAFVNDVPYITTAVTNPINNTLTAHTADSTVHVSAQEKNTWNSKSNFSGDYNDLTNKPTNISSFVNDVPYITNSDLSNYATKSDLSAHTADTSIHVTNAEKTNWNNKSNFSGDYNDLSNKPTIPVVPTNVSAFVNDVPYITTAVTNPINNTLTAHTADTTAHVTQSDKNTWNSKQDELSVGNGISIVNNTISLDLPISAGTGANSLIYNDIYHNIATGNYSHAEGNNTVASGTCSHAEGYFNVASGSSSHAEGNNTNAGGNYAHAEGQYTVASELCSHAEGMNTNAGGSSSHAEGNNTVASGTCSHAEGSHTQAYNTNEHASGRYNISSNSSGVTLFTVGNGSLVNDVEQRHNALQINLNGDLFYADTNASGERYEKPMLKLQDIHTNYYNVELNADGSVLSADSMSRSKITENLNNPLTNDALDVKWNYAANQSERIIVPAVSVPDSTKVTFSTVFMHGSNKVLIVLTLNSSNVISLTTMTSLEDTENKKDSVVNNLSSQYYPSTNAVYSEFQRKPVVVWEANDPANYLRAIQADITTTPAWQITNLDLTPYKRIKVYTCAGRATGATANASTTAAMVLEIILDSRAGLSAVGGHFVGSVMSQKPNDANRLATLTCAVSADKTSFVVLRQTSLYGTAATSNNDVNSNVFLIEGFYD